MSTYLQCDDREKYAAYMLELPQYQNMHPSLRLQLGRAYGVDYTRKWVRPAAEALVCIPAHQFSPLHLEDMGSLTVSIILNAQQRVLTHRIRLSVEPPSVIHGICSDEAQCCHTFSIAWTYVARALLHPDNAQTPPDEVRKKIANLFIVRMGLGCQKATLESSTMVMRFKQENDVYKEAVDEIVAM